jgi:hypothetical protein
MEPSSSQNQSVVKLKGPQKYDVLALKIKMVLIRDGLWSIVDPLTTTATVEEEKGETEEKEGKVVAVD